MADELVFYSMEDNLFTVFENAIKSVDQKIASSINGFQISLGGRYDNNGQTVQFWVDVPTSTREDVVWRKQVLLEEKFRAMIFLQFKSEYFMIKEDSGSNFFSSAWAHAIRVWGENQYEGIRQILRLHPVCRVVCVKDEKGWAQMMMVFNLTKNNPPSLYDLYI